MKKPTLKQQWRQAREYRSNGRYALVNPCYACGKSAGVDYYSHPLTDQGDWHDAALCLCKKCADATQDMTLVDQFLEYKKQFGDKSDQAWEKVCRQRDRK